MDNEGAPHPRPRPRPDIEPVSYVDSAGLISVAVHKRPHGVWAAHVAGEVDMMTGPLLQEQFNKLLATQPETLIIDLSQVTFLGSTGLSVLITTRHTARQQGTALQLRGTERRAVAVPLKITGLDHLFETVPSSGHRNRPLPSSDARSGGRRNR